MTWRASAVAKAMADKSSPAKYIINPAQAPPLYEKDGAGMTRRASAIAKAMADKSSPAKHPPPVQ
jgi:hypothetical protein